MAIKFKGRETVGNIYVAKRGDHLLGWRHQKDLGIILNANSPEQVLSISNIGNDALIVNEFPEVFSDKLGLLAGFKHKIILKASARPVVHKVRKVPLLMLSPLQDELNRLLSLGVIEEIEASEWLAPIVLVPKDNGSKIRMCVDLRGLNQCIWVDRQPLPNINEMLTMLSQAKVFSVLDLSAAYHQVLLHEDSRHLTSFVTPLGAFRFIRMPFGLALAAACFQRVMKEVLKDLNSVLFFQDDMLIYGKDEEEHDVALRAVLRRLKEKGLTVKKEECKFRVGTVSYLGNTISGDGIKPKVTLARSIIAMPTTSDRDQMRSFLGLAEYYSKFIKNFASVVQPLRVMLKKGIDFVWSPECEEAFNIVKSRIGEMPTLGHFDT
ncbi:hypothetical protein NDU88_002026 [Pleurodeles waltl]|uniref:ribonuclease H n=1 Tax=Pleurodeles waltl TaxID=8319 RepID=A0AAV7VDE9_PLEWA|nr:hypothetical protein NDU88_002026 [Pleurodeles waltl]